jgi:predicted transcriptional regulator of viral defense system
MNALAALTILKSTGVSMIETKDAAIKLGLSNESASQLLRRLSLEKQIVHLSRGLWLLDPTIHPFLIPEYLTAPFPCYISLQTALYHHGMIDQIPRMITVISTTRTRKVQTSVATVSIHHIIPDFFFGYEVDSKTLIKMASPEKALLDFCYLKPAKSLWFQNLPELEIPKSFNHQKAFDMIQKIPSPSRRTIVASLLEAYIRPR